MLLDARLNLPGPPVLHPASPRYRSQAHLVGPSLAPFLPISRSWLRPGKRAAHASWVGLCKAGFVAGWSSAINQLNSTSTAPCMICPSESDAAEALSG